MEERHEEIEVPEDVAKALLANPTAAAVWEKLSDHHRHAHVVGVLRKQDPEARTRRIDETIEHLLGEEEVPEPTLHPRRQEDEALDRRGLS
jgi:uncharacterized protein YdeI (YjbR/CyaY-like superfamily)